MHRQKMLSDVMSEHVFFKIFLGACPRPPSKSMLCMLGMLHMLDMLRTLAIYM